MKNTKRDSSLSPASREQLTFVDRHSSRQGQVRRRSSHHAGGPLHASFVWCVSSCFSCGLYNKNVLIVFSDGLVLLLLANALVCLEREEESMRMKGCSSVRQVRRGCIFRPGRYLFWCPLVGAESDSCGRNGRWNGLIFVHNRVHVQNQGAVLRKGSPHGVHPVHFPARQGEKERRPISSAQFTLDVNGYPVVSPNEQGAPCCVVYP